MRRFGTSLSGGLRPASYQLVPLTKLLLNQQQSVLICDGVGVGKTISAALALSYLTQASRRPGLVVCPPSLLEKWRAELRSKFLFTVIPVRSPEELSTADDEWNLTEGQPRRIYVMPSSLLMRSTPPSFSGPVVIDEIHHYRNPETRLWSSAKRLLESAPYRIGLSATPINNDLADLAAELSLLLRLNRYVADAIISDLWRPEFRELLYSVLTRFSKERLGIHFAARLIRDVHVEFPRQYGREVISAVKELRGRPVTESVFRDEITYFRLAASSPRAFAASIKVPTSRPGAKIDALRGVLQRHDREPILVFCEFEETARELSEFIADRPAFLMTGSVPVFEREIVLSRFREQTNGVLVMTSVGTEGLDLQFCSALVNFDLTWNPMILEQRVGRIDRIGQQKPSVYVYNIIVDGSIDERVMRVLGAKLGLLNGTMLEAASVLGHGPPTARLWDDATVSDEISRAEALATSLELSTGIIPEDYAVLDEIDAAYCDGDRLRDTAQEGRGISWLNGGEWSRRWSEGVAAMGAGLQTRIRRYS